MAQVTLEQISSLFDAKLTPLREDIELIKTQAATKDNFATFSTHFDAKFNELNAKFEQLHTRVSVIENLPPPPAPLFQDFSMADSDHPDPKRLRSSSAPPRPDRASPPAHEGKSYCARLGGFPYKYTSTDLIEWAQTYAKSICPSHVTLKFHCSSTAKSVLIEFPETKDANAAIEASSQNPCVWFDPEDPDTRATLRLKHDASPDARRVGGLLSVLYQAAETHIGKATQGLSPAPSFSLKTDRPRRELLLKAGRRILTIAEISPPDQNGMTYINKNISHKGFPSYLSPEVLQNIYKQAEEDSQFIPS